jgi:hypothetical protein
MRVCGMRSRPPFPAAASIAALPTVYCCLPCIAAYRALLPTVYCCLPCIAAYRVLLPTVHCCLPCIAVRQAHAHGMLLPLHCSASHSRQEKGSFHVWTCPTKA